LLFINLSDTLPDASRWKDLKSISMAESERIIKTSTDKRHYICTLPNVKPIAHAPQAHIG
jgi:hypothetical protein